jgi:hypothetical protein
VSQFHISDSKSLRIAREALHHRKPITISGTVGKGIRFFTGVVHITAVWAAHTSAAVGTADTRDSERKSRHCLRGSTHTAAAM